MTQRRPLAAVPWRLFARLAVVTAWVGAAWRASHGLRGQGYRLWPPSPNTWALIHDATLYAVLGAILLWIALALPWKSALASERPRARLARAWASLPALVLWVAWGYRFNRFEMAGGGKRRVELFGRSVPEALTDPATMGGNLLATALAVFAAVIVYRILRRILPETRQDSALRAPGWLVIAVLIPILFVAAMPPPLIRPRAAGPDIILISLDATRADHFGAYGHGGGLTPVSDGFAESAELFENAYAPEPWTLTSHMTMLTGLYPDAHGLDFGRALPPSIWTVAERLRDAGYRTHATVYDCFLLSPRFGYAAGFDSYHESDAPASERCAAAAEWLLDSERPGFLFVHLYDPHSDTGKLPYEAGSEALERLAPAARAAFAAWTGGDGASESLRKVNEQGLEMSEALRAQLRALYAAGLWETDHALAELFGRLRAARRLDDALVILTADHGEALGEQQHFMHERLMNATLHIPLMVHWPGGQNAGERREPLAELVDLAPTILGVAGLPPEEIAQGHRLDRPTASARPFAFHRSGPEHAISTAGGWRLVYRRDPEIYGTSLRRIDGSGGDGPDVLADSLQFVERWVRAIEEKHRANEILAARFRDGSSVSMSELDEELLRSLGYID
ncbi:MAG TPA: sulfatase [Candidatus Krumholzibacteria bacterium]